MRHGSSGRLRLPPHSFRVIISEWTDEHEVSPGRFVYVLENQIAYELPILLWVGRLCFWKLSRPTQMAQTTKTRVARAASCRIGHGPRHPTQQLVTEAAPRGLAHAACPRLRCSSITRADENLQYLPVSCLVTNGPRSLPPATFRYPISEPSNHKRGLSAIATTQVAHCFLVRHRSKSSALCTSAVAVGTR